MSCSMRTNGRTDGQTDMTKLRVTFRNFANACKTLAVPGMEKRPLGRRAQNVATVPTEPATNYTCFVAAPQPEQM
jgi:hypothetical protein